MRIYFKNKSLVNSRIVLSVTQGSMSIPDDPENVTVSMPNETTAMMCLAPHTYPIVPMIEYTEEELG